MDVTTYEVTSEMVSRSVGGSKNWIRKIRNNNLFLDTLWCFCLRRKFWLVGTLDV